MTGVEAIFLRCQELGVALIPTERGTLKVRASARPPEDLLVAMKRLKREILLRLRPPHEPLAPPPVTGPEHSAALIEEEALFRVYWLSLPDKRLARKTWPSEVRWYCGQKGLGSEVLKELEGRCRDLIEEKP